LIGGIQFLAAGEIAERRMATWLKLDFSNSKRIIFHVKSSIVKSRSIIPKACFAWLKFSHANKFFISFPKIELLL
jgi:hypothetical protein